MSDVKVKKRDGVYSDEIYRQRINRSQAWLGNSEKEQVAAQKAIYESTVGVAGCEGAGGTMAMRPARLGVRHIKVADADPFVWTNLNRQFESSRVTVGKNKAEVIGHLC